MNFSFDVLFPFIVDELMGKTNKSFIKPKLVRKHIGVPLHIFSNESL